MYSVFDFYHLFHSWCICFKFRLFSACSNYLANIQNDISYCQDIFVTNNKLCMGISEVVTLLVKWPDKRHTYVFIYYHKDKGCH